MQQPQGLGGGMNLKKINFEKWASMLFCLAFVGALGFLALRYLLPVCIPFFAAWLLAALVRAPAQGLSKHLHLPQKLCAPVLLCLFTALLVWLSGLAVRSLLSELSRLAERTLSGQGALGAMLDSEPFEILSERIPLLARLELFERHPELRERLHTAVSELSSELVHSITAGIPRFVGRVVSALPTVFLATVVTLIAGFTLCIEGDALRAGAWSHIPLLWQQRLSRVGERLREFFRGYLQAYLWLLLLTFGELLIGFLLLRVEYAFLLALLIAVVDMLPVLGVGTVLIPWAVIELLQKDYRLGVGLLILFGAVSLMRQILEPRLVGRRLGLHPLLTLFASYAGWQLFGFLGMLLAPLAVMAIKSAVVLLFWNKDHLCITDKNRKK